MKKFDFNKKKKVFFSGIGGISMSGLAKLLLHEGFKLSGSDSAKSDLTVELEKLGAEINYCQSEKNISEDIELVVHSAAIKRTNEELIKAENMGKEILTRAEFLGSVMRNYETVIGISGTHGKTTTTSMISDIFLNANLDPTISVGGIMPSINDNFRIGSKDIFITEACEYTNSFLSFYPTCAVILNCELDHTDFFKDEDDFRNSFRLYAQNIQKDGKLIINNSIKDIDYFTNEHINVITFGIEDDSDYEAKNVEIISDKYIDFDLYHKGNEISKIRLNTIGKYNIENALAAIATALEHDIDIEVIKGTLETFNSTKRRFEMMGEVAGVKVISDFAHHPTAIKYAIETARLLEHKKLWVVFQPHAYSRTKEFLKEFASVLKLADAVILTPIYAAREVNTYDIYSKDIYDLLISYGCESFNADGFSEAEDIVLTHAQSGDVVIAMGGGDIDKLAKDLVGISYAHN